MGWMIFKQNPQKIGRVDISDINNDPVVIWQHRNFLSVALGMGFVFPCVVAGLGWGDWMGGLIYAGIIRMFTPTHKRIPHKYYY
jgi:stearoyl-CoA desaturase (delta-9 desaturase)